jgi:hypothetical protein
VDFAGRHAIGPAAPVGALAAILVVSVVGLQVLQPSPREVRLGETEMAQRSAAVVASTYRASVDIDRRDRMLLVSYADAAPLNADRFAWAVCDTIRTVPDTSGSAKVLRDWQVVTMPQSGMPGSCRIGG